MTRDLEFARARLGPRRLSVACRPRLATRICEVTAVSIGVSKEHQREDTFEAVTLRLTNDEVTLVDEASPHTELSTDRVLRAFAQHRGRPRLTRLDLHGDCREGTTENIER